MVWFIEVDLESRNIGNSTAGIGGEHQGYLYLNMQLFLVPNLELKIYRTKYFGFRWYSVKE
jgi:hypothetical protein